MQRLQKKRSAAKNSERPHLAEPLNPQQIEIIDFFVRLAPLLGQPRSVAEIYGLLFSSPQPLALNDVIQRLRLSKGSASNGLNMLLRLGAAKRTYVSRRRSAHYEALVDLESLTVRFLRERVLPHLGGNQIRLKWAAPVAKDLTAGEQKRVNMRVRMLQNWQCKGRRLLCLAERNLTGGSSLRE
jgi:DNA-binding transcriptional regulator GbsR (MarR family)